MTDGRPTFAFEYDTREPSGRLRDYVELVWYARGTVPYARERIAPTGSTVAVIVLGDPIIETPDNHDGPALKTATGFLVGPHVGPVVNEPTGETYAVGIVTTPVGCRAVFGVSPAELRGRVVDLLETWPAAAALRAALTKLTAPRDMLALVEETLVGHLGPDHPGDRRCAAAVAALEADPSCAIGDIAAGLGISHGHLDREFTRIVGLTPRSLATLLRMRRLLARLDVRREIDWAKHAFELGWFDQAHLIRDFKRHTGVTPTEYVAAQRAVYSPVAPGDAAGFVPDM